MSERTTVQIPLEMETDLKDDLDEIVRLSGVGSRMGLIRLACRQYIDRFWTERNAALQAQQSERRPVQEAA